MKIGNDVISKKTGLPASGVVVGLVTGEFYLGITRRPVETFVKWNQLYPEWVEKSIIYVKLSSPQKSMSFEEFKEYSDPSITEDKLKVLYDYQVPLSPHIAYPEDDLEVLE